jgi:hypothetical protein
MASVDANPSTRTPPGTTPHGGPVDLVLASSSEEHAILAPVSHPAEHPYDTRLRQIIRKPRECTDDTVTYFVVRSMIHLLLITLFLLMILFGGWLWMMSIVLSLKILLGTLFLLALA